MTDGTKPSTSGTITVAATAEETRTAIDALLSLGTDLPVPDTDFNENAALVPLAPQPHDVNQPIEPTNALQPSIIGTAVKIEDKGTTPKSAQSDAKKKKTFVTVEYKLKWKYVTLERPIRLCSATCVKKYLIHQQQWSNTGTTTMSTCMSVTTAERDSTFKAS